MSHTLRFQPRQPRGRALIECIVAAMLLAITTLALASSARGTLALADDSQLVTHAQSLTTTRVEDALGSSCGANTNGLDQRPRLSILWQQSSAAHTAQLHLDVTLDRSPIAFGSGTPIFFGVDAGSVCP